MHTTTHSRFEQSFVFHMIRDFFLLLLAVAAVELAIRYAALRWDFAYEEPARVDAATKQLANDIKSIMLNAGGPTAALTVYPILDRNYSDLGLDIAVQPSAVTVASMKESRNMDVQGLQPHWGPGAHEQASVSLKAEAYCLSCHVKARVGDVLGTVTVRSYLDRKESAWWQQVRLTAGALSLKILVHTILLFMLMKVRMAPLLALRGTVSGLAKGVMDLSPRAGVQTMDEFGELAEDLNHFLDRITQVVNDLDKILSEVVDVGSRLSLLNRGLERHLDGMRNLSLQGLSAGAQQGLEQRLAVARMGGAFDAHLQALTQTVNALATVGQMPAPARAALHEPLARAQASLAQWDGSLHDAVIKASPHEAQAEDYRVFAQALRDMAVLEATMQKVAEAGQQVLARLTHGRVQTVAAGQGPAVVKAQSAS